MRASLLLSTLCYAQGSSQAGAPETPGLKRLNSNERRLISFCGTGFSCAFHSQCWDAAKSYSVYTAQEIGGS
ncbi:hypothetical protein LDENG_00204730 [Lucifuga dentata]|nr:hypothetical protein LDENG_00204730 [Lucifuga dentata]